MNTAPSSSIHQNKQELQQLFQKTHPLKQLMRVFIKKSDEKIIILIRNMCHIYFEYTFKHETNESIVFVLDWTDTKVVQWIHGDLRKRLPYQDYLDPSEKLF